jgi:hypothetical protein
MCAGECYVCMCVCVCFVCVCVCVCVWCECECVSVSVSVSVCVCVCFSKYTFCSYLEALFEKTFLLQLLANCRRRRV